jgi:hypothetical protein
MVPAFWIDLAVHIAPQGDMGDRDGQQQLAAIEIDLGTRDQCQQIHALGLK